MRYDCIVIGAGVGGLFCAFRLSQEGKRVLLVEKLPVPGGFATTFRRKGFIFESSIHCVNALHEDGDIREFLRQSGLEKDIDLLPLENFGRIIFPGHQFVANFKIEDLKDFLKSNFPHENKSIDRLFRSMEKFYGQFDRWRDIDAPAWLVNLLIPIFCRRVFKVMRQNAEEFITRAVKDKKILALFTDIWRFMGLPPSRLSAFYFLIVFRAYNYHATCYVKGGFSQLFNAIVKKLEASGSRVIFNTSVKKILVENKRVKGIVTDKGESFFATSVVSNANAIDTLTAMVDDGSIKGFYLPRLASLEKSISAFRVYLGLSKPAKELGMDDCMFSVNSTYDHDEDYRRVLAGDYEHSSFAIVDNAKIDQSLVPAGKGSLLIQCLDAYDNWKGLREEEYRKKKVQVTECLVQRAEKYLPGLSSYIEVVEAGTPLTMERYGSSPEGAIYGFAQTVAQSGLSRLGQKTKVKGLFLAGGWTFPGGGVHACYLSGLNAAELVLKYIK
jgi:prolycopene isomerase